MIAPPWIRVSDRWSQRSLRSLRMVWAETSKRLARSSTVTRPNVRARFRISFWRFVSPVTAAPQVNPPLMVRLFRRPVNGRRPAPIALDCRINGPLLTKASRQQGALLSSKARRKPSIKQEVSGNLSALGVRSIEHEHAPVSADSGRCRHLFWGAGGGRAVLGRRPLGGCAEVKATGGARRGSADPGSRSSQR